ncbi:mitochondrial genome maintenance exonuclease 1-like [Scleropages formosus]|uniref:Mitochondrial genome maintenance exonuclease 1 n=1 Tax=Scleropages formosus TaxID=113540 RepID=A0A0P7VE19_SCLFO|nr:mitochondrial genome maintenance exonuclease 1-like [Scleropages formosus]
MCLSTSCVRNGRKKSSQYSSVDTGKYSSLVKSVVSSRTSPQTPASLEEEDRHIYGPVVKSKPPSEPARSTPRNPYPLLCPTKTPHPTLPENDEGIPARITLQRGPGKSVVPSVTRILQQTMSPEQSFYLERWRQRMIAELGEEGFKEYTLTLERILMPGKIAPEDEGSSELVEGYIESVQHVLDDIRGVRAIESVVKHPSLNYLGLVDCVAMYRGRLCVIDWKTSEKPKPFLRNTYDNPIQIAAYVGAINSDDNYNYQVENGLVVVAYKDGSPAHSHFMALDLCQEYWTRWLLRLEEFAEKKQLTSDRH